MDLSDTLMEVVKESEASIRDSVNELKSVVDVAKGFLLEFDFVESVEVVRDDVLFNIKFKKELYKLSYRSDVRKLLSFFIDDIMVGNLIRVIIRSSDNIAELESYLTFDLKNNY